MGGVLRNLGDHSDRVWVVVGATPTELAALGLDPPPPHLVLIRSGVGKASAAAAIARALDPERHAGVLSIGLAGALPGSGLAIGDIVIASHMILADEGSQNPDGFRDIASMGFGPMPDGSVSAPATPNLVALLGSAIPGARIGPIATVSTCSGTDARASEIAARTGAIAEAMEGAAVAIAAAHVAGPAFPVAEIRAISNTTGDRPKQVWDLARGFAALTRIGRVL